MDKARNRSAGTPVQPRRPWLAADQVVHQITADDVIKAKKALKPDETDSPPRAAKGDDDLMSQPRKH